MAASSSYSPVHQLWPPPEGNQRTQLDVVFFHGLGLTEEDSSDAWRSTWTQRDHDDVCWPQKWLPDDLVEAVRIFSISYNAHVATSPHDHVSGIADNLVQSLIKGYEWDHPIVLIGHSFGGLVLKSLVVQLKLRIAIDNAPDLCSKATVQSGKMFLSNVTGVVFYAVPHAGSVNFDEYIKKLLSCNNTHHRGIMDNLKLWQQDMENLSVAFNEVVIENKIEIYAFCEGRPMEQVGILVEGSSAQRLARRNYYKVEDANHMEVCKPPFKEHLSYKLLLDFINLCQKNVKVSTKSQEDHDLPHAMFGLKKYVEKVETLMTSNDENLHYVGVRGMGGVGKTLLLHNVYESSRVLRHFQGAKFIWLTVGRSPHIMTLYRTLSAELSLPEEKTQNAVDYKSKLLFHFKKERVFLVLDDVWEDKTFNALNLAKGEGSATLLSTRNLFVFERANAKISEVHMLPLSNEDSWNLFCMHAFKPPSNIACDIEEMAQAMAMQCQGLPLALKVIGSVMCHKAACEWKEALKKLSESHLQESYVEEDLYEYLKVGYDLLSKDDPRLKDCFLYFSAFPEDCVIDFHEILRHWMGEGWVPEKGGDDARVDTFSLLKMLWKRSFIEPDKYQRYKLDEGNLLDEEGFLTFKIHDVMRDMAFYILKSDAGLPHAKQLYFYGAGRNLEEFPQDWKVTSEALRLSLRRNKLKRLPGNFYAPELVSLLLGENPIQSVPESFLSNFPKLRVLDLMHGQFDSLPDNLGDLKDLVCLDLSHCQMLEKLPETVVELHKLKCLLLRECSKLKYLPSGVAKLTSLQVLHTMDCESLTWSEHTPSRMGESSDHVDANIRASLEDICELVVLTQLSINGKKDCTFGLCLEVVPWQMSSCFKQLQELDFWNFQNLKFLPNSFTYPGAFPALINLGLGSCSLVEFPEVHEGALPKLRRLDILGCTSLKSLPPSLEFLTSLRELIVTNCEKSLKDSCRRNCKSSERWRKFEIEDDMYPLELSEDENLSLDLSEDEDLALELCEDEDLSLELSKDEDLALELCEDEDLALELSEDEDLALE